MGCGTIVIQILILILFGFGFGRFGFGYSLVMVWFGLGYSLVSYVRPALSAIFSATLIIVLRQFLTVLYDMQIFDATLTQLS